MDLNEYQKKAMSTCLPSSNNFSYMMLNLIGEVGEFASKVAKAIRKDKANIDDNHLTFGFTVDKETVNDKQKREDVAKNETALYMVQQEELKKEAGDILWQLAGLCSVMGWELEDVAKHNLDKLASRAKRNVIDGNGDNR